MCQTQELTEILPQSPSSNYQLDDEFEATLQKRSTPERRLMVAILRRAIWDFALYRDMEPDTERYELAVDAAGWIFWDGEETLDEEGRYSFMHVCASLDLDTTSLRKAVLRLTRENIGKITRRIETEI
jgi:hypothetical protein